MASGRLRGALVYDAGALLAAERGDPEMIALHAEVNAAGIQPIVPVVALAQAWRGGPQHRISWLLKGCEVLPDDERLGRAAGVACASSRTVDVVDALVVAMALRHNAAVVTSDPADLRRVADAVGIKLALFVV
ncbi:MAG: PIN domain-containing protein [Carbonactinosporaceae bacterium]